ncbi:hypothetical protein SDC9_69385 [bioreactor metagenome]|uniref:Uncharacterized protein n=1 Tax=bioreactor metagenome TaxID=1076179 RepID=A0A644Y305_9ZZZZ
MNERRGLLSLPRVGGMPVPAPEQGQDQHGIDQVIAVKEIDPAVGGNVNPAEPCLEHLVGHPEKDRIDRQAEDGDGAGQINQK